MKQRCIFAAGCICAGLASPLERSLRAQQSDSLRVPTAALLGRMVSSLDRGPVRSAEIRLVFVDSVRPFRNRDGSDSLEVFADSNRRRVAVTDSTGAFAIRRLAAGRYVFQVRRIGYQPLEGAVVVDTGTVRATLVLLVVSQMLAEVVVTETAIDKVKERLDRVGFVERSRLGVSATFVRRAEILRRRPQTVGDILSAYGIRAGTFMLDRMEFDYESIRDYPAELVIGVEIYRHSRPVEFNMTRRGPMSLSPGGHAASMQPLVLIWTFTRWR